MSGLANRPLFRDRLEHALARAARSLTSLAVLFLDLDDFKLVNDSLGHAAGDELLVAVAERSSGSLRTGDTAARFGGDEFAILLEETKDPEDACLAAERILADLKPPLWVNERSVIVHASIGIAYSKIGAEARPRSCRRPTWPCTRPRPRARTVTRSTSPRCRQL